MSASVHAQSFDPDLRPFGFLQTDAGTLYTHKTTSDRHSARDNGRRLGRHLVYAGLNVQQTYNDNIYLTNTSEAGDFITTLAPFVRVERDVGRHDFTIGAEGAHRQYWNHSDENTTDAVGYIAGTLEGYHNLKFPFSARFKRDHRARSNRDITGISREPTRFNQFKADLGVLYTPGAFEWSSTVRFMQTRLFGGRARNTGARLTNEDGDEDRLSWESRVTYSEISESLTPFANLNFTRSDFVRGTFNGTDFSGLQRDYKSYAFNLGSDFDHHGIIGGTASVGREHRLYDESAIGDRHDNTAKLDLYYTPRPDWRLGIKLERAVREDNLIQSGVEDFVAGTSLSHDLQDHVMFQARMGYRNRDFTNLTREDDLYGLGADLTYRISPGLALKGGYTFRKADSTSSAFQYDNHQVFVRAETAL